MYQSYVLGTCSWLLLREAPVIVGDALGKDAEVTGWQADGRGPAGWECSLLGAGLWKEVESLLERCLVACWPDLLRSSFGILEEERVLGRRRL